nr:hypothetical protein [Pirellulaceae bacterium]
MSSSGADRDDGYERPFAEGPTEESADATANGELMDQVLQETLAATDADTPLDPSELEALIDVARQHSGQTLASVVVELVEAVLATRFGGISDGGDRWRSMASAIAETLMDDPASRDRLESLWARLCEAAG